MFYLMDHYDVSLRIGQILIFTFMAFGVIGTFFGGLLSDRIGRKNVILLSVVVPMPFCLALPYVPLWAATVFLIVISVLIMISFSVTRYLSAGACPDENWYDGRLNDGLCFWYGCNWGDCDWCVNGS